MTIEEAARLWALARMEKDDARNQLRNWRTLADLPDDYDADEFHTRATGDGYEYLERCYHYAEEKHPWCDVCRLRQPYYQAYRLAIAKESGARRRLFRLASAKEGNS